MTIKEYQMTLRLREASRLLCETDLSITEIASEAGFYDVFFFSKTFRKEKGITPSEFRKTYTPRI